ncbi:MULTISPECIES: hypothetical protein [unclassified Streptomyces]|uniref:hypothetical protein n=1 Tax=unclassified Streptomyces TaxID=2593676 RepID=UPI001587D349|nr:MULTISPECIES: hypothetical protein [unclassified Streptomyces]NUV68546.1 hypothetical protein [Streptomyces sp. CAI-121]NUW00794.1 hypothetical protein [Streptomyces sp. CAI 127]NUW14644.1 hypothetical protein [Streptomyces sp. CAI-68]
MTLTLVDRTRRTDAATGKDADASPDRDVVDPGAAPEPEKSPDSAPRRAAGREADGLAVASFVLGLVGLLVFNIVLGPMAIVMALLALTRRTRRRGRAFLGLALGVADLVVLAALVTANGTVAWSIGG